MAERTKAKRGRAPAASEAGGSVGKAIAVLRAFIDGQEAWGVRELANALGQPGSSVHRLLQILRREGLVEWDAENQKYRTGMEFFRWSAILGRRMKLADVARPLMSELATRIGDSCWLGLFEASERRHVYVAEVKSERTLSYAAPLGRYEPPWRTAGGLAALAFLSDLDRRAMLADAITTGTLPHLPGALPEFLRQIKSDGYAIVSEPGEEAPVMVAAPVFDAHNAPIASLTVAVPPFRFGAAREPGIGAAVAEAANRLSRLIGSQVLGAAGIGTWHLGVTAIGDLLQRKVPGIGATIWSGGGDKVLRDLQNGRGAYCFAVAASLHAAFHGEAPFSRSGGQLRAMFSLFPLFLHVVAHRGPPVNRFGELRGLRISAGEADFTTARVVGELFQQAGFAGRKRGTETLLVHLDYAEANREFAAGKLDAVISLTGLGDPSYRDLDRQIGIQLVPLEDDHVERFVARHPLYGRGTIPAGTYAGWDRPTPTLAAPTVMVTTADRSEEEVYAVTRGIYEARSDLAAILPAFNALGPDTLFQGIDVPLHPGALRYWREIGVLDARALPSMRSKPRAPSRHRSVRKG